jgi:hypothetical protein
MYNILFHVSGIAILEICFYFSYIGPMETTIFEKVVGKLGNELVQLVDTNMNLLENIAYENMNSLNPTSPPYYITNNEINLSSSSSRYLLEIDTVYDLATSNQFSIGGFFPGLTVNNGNTSQTNDEYMENIRRDAEEERNKKNQKLFIQIIEYWGILAGISVFIYIVEHNYKSYTKNKIERSIVPVTSEENDIEMQNVVRYRKGSDIEDNMLVHENTKIYCDKNCTQRLGYAVHYLMFGCCIIGFQYLFFENVVLKYDPLSINEVKYLLYLKFKPILEELGY